MRFNWAFLEQRMRAASAFPQTVLQLHDSRSGRLRLIAQALDLRDK